MRRMRANAHTRLQAVEKSASSALQHPITRHNLVVFRGGHDALQVTQILDATRKKAVCLVGLSTH